MTELADDGRRIGRLVDKSPQEDQTQKELVSLKSVTRTDGRRKSPLKRRQQRNNKPTDRKEALGSKSPRKPSGDQDGDIPVCPLRFAEPSKEAVMSNYCPRADEPTKKPTVNATSPRVFRFRSVLFAPSERTSRG